MADAASWAQAPPNPSAAHTLRQSLYSIIDVRAPRIGDAMASVDVSVLLSIVKDSQLFERLTVDVGQVQQALGMTSPPETLTNEQCFAAFVDLLRVQFVANVSCELYAALSCV